MRVPNGRGLLSLARASGSCIPRLAGAVVVPRSPFTTMRTVVLISFVMHSFLSFGQTEKWLVGGEASTFDKEYRVPDASWEITRIDTGAAVFVYDDDVAMIIGSIRGVPMLTVSNVGDCKPSTRRYTSLVMSLPILIPLGADVRIRCEPWQYVWITRRKMR